MRQKNSTNANLIELVFQTLMNCPETCKIEKENEVIIEVPLDKLMERLTEEIRKTIYDILTDGVLVEDLKKHLEKEKGKNFTGKVIKDMDGVIFKFKTLE